MSGDKNEGGKNQTWMSGFSDETYFAGMDAGFVRRKK